MTMNPTAAEMQTASKDVPFQPEPRYTSGGSAWRGWIVFAGVMLMLVGSFQLIAGLVALFEDQYYLVGQNGLVVHVNYTAWGWIHIGLAVINMLAGFGLFTGKTWARVWAVIVAGLSAIVNLGFTSAYPIWVIMMVTLDVIVMYALLAHWDEMKEAR
ncbi:MAG TPA: hypothetical protein VFH38_07345 [Jatrophihabitans sp.]|nr:hypothetical protein [Jatrophihabitans sp.]